MITGISVNVKGHWSDFTSAEYREYQRQYQKMRYVPHGRKDKHAYYLENKETIKGKLAYKKAAGTFRHILL